ncbi:threonine synthase [Geobacillus subterraneus]|uniref:Threonine synthase n=2 Tax=Geobacillus TaxID=129337 RepID=A0ABN4NMG9_9BACL|nr:MULTISPECIES: threonine synthase [Geobacillus]AMX83569.1 threonine synthase [Geobacillus subterraneus]KZS25006.1 threonine synthase [Geobacillus subterraneus]OXB87800.1 threonine synthase [Geobacillus uzenensis]WPZ20019.1 threonine synthase [Geobacillus subterraneus]
MSFSYVSHLYCPKCEHTYDVDHVHQLCECGSPLLVAYDLEAMRQEVVREALKEREPSLWRYHELLPVKRPEHIVSLGEGMTPLVPMPRLGRNIGIDSLYMKDEGVIPTGTFKARGAAVGVSKAKELGVKQLAMPTNGNAGAAWSLYASRAGIRATVVMPVDAPELTRKECAIAGAELYFVNGLISDAGQIVAKAIRECGWYDASTLKEPYRIEGKKTMGLEIAEQFSWQLPDVILYPTGGGVGLIGIYKAIKELQALGWVSGKMPRLVAVQAEHCAPIVKAWNEKKRESEFWPNSHTVAFGINVPKALGDFLVLEAVYETDGCAIAISDKDILAEQRAVANLEGAFICPEGAAAFAAARKLRGSGWIRDGETVVVLNTGTGLKYADLIQVAPPVLERGDELPRSGR